MQCRLEAATQEATTAVVDEEPRAVAVEVEFVVAMEDALVAMATQEECNYMAKAGQS